MAEMLHNLYWRLRYFFGYEPKWQELPDVIYDLEPDDTPLLTALRNRD